MPSQPEKLVTMGQAEKATRATDAYRALKHQIRWNKLPPGFQSPEPELALRLGVSRTTLREALIRLETEGLIELIPRRGARVLPMRADDMKEVYGILMLLEPEIAADLAARRLSEAELAPLNGAAAQMEEALKEGDLDSWAEADDRLHMGMLELHGNARLMSIISELWDQIYRARMITLRLRDLPFQSNTEHRSILDSIQRGDAEQARQDIRAHRARAARELVAILEKSGIGQL